MTKPEFLAWQHFYKLHPFDDFHRYFRPAALVASAMNGEKFDSLLAWLEKRPYSATYSDADLASIKALGFSPPMRN